ncbi:MAG: hypothetical protein QMD01_01425 [Thermodesulfovibrionales bacterium]|nr:hypothetical protein [Thermodesulfovibrionales bacterium]
MKSLFEILSPFCVEGKTGQFSIAVKNENHLVKFFLSNGEIHHIRYGNHQNEQCLSMLDDLHLSTYSFIDMASNGSIRPIEKSTPDILQYLRLIKCNDMKSFDESFGESSGIKNEIIDKLCIAFIRQIGPVGNMLFKKMKEQHIRSSPPTRMELEALIAGLSEKIDEQKYQTNFVKEARSILE